jgi:hypothetical protein
LSDKLRSHLVAVAENGAGGPQQPVVHSAAVDRMAKMPLYSKSGAADNTALFHGREVRHVPLAAGGMQFVLQLVLAGGDDPEGWSPQELKGYDGWGHDGSRKWRRCDELESEGVAMFKAKFGPKANTLNHRFYWHLDKSNQMWLSAEDGCEGRLHACDAAHC